MMASSCFFAKLKETCRKIDDDVSNIKTKMIGSYDDYDKEEITAKGICRIQDQISALKTDANGLRNMLGPKLEHTRDYIKHIKELLAETEVSISNREENLKQYGYIPMEAGPQILDVPVETNTTPDKKVKEDLPKTPNLLDYGISSHFMAITPELKSSTENLKHFKSYKYSASTPTLNVAAITLPSKPSETPPFPEPLYTLAKETLFSGQLYRSAKETPPLPDPLYTAAKETPPFPEPLYTPAKETPPLPEPLFASTNLQPSKFNF